jgi:hypothetical protein
VVVTSTARELLDDLLVALDEAHKALFALAQAEDAPRMVKQEARECDGTITSVIGVAHHLRAELSRSAD